MFRNWARVLESGDKATVSELASRLQIAKPWEQSRRMLRITLVESSEDAGTLRVEGRVAGPWLEELRKTCDAYRDVDPIRLVLDLEDVSFVDAAGVAYLKELKEQGVVLSGASPFLAELFKSDLSPDGNSRE